MIVLSTAAGATDGNVDNTDSETNEATETTTVGTTASDNESTEESLVVTDTTDPGRIIEILLLHGLGHFKERAKQTEKFNLFTN